MNIVSGTTVAQNTKNQIALKMPFTAIAPFREPILA